MALTVPPENMALPPDALTVPPPLLTFQNILEPPHFLHTTGEPFLLLAVPDRNSGQEHIITAYFVPGGITTAWAAGMTATVGGG